MEENLSVKFQKSQVGLLIGRKFRVDHFSFDENLVG
jgi:hypothetical protein